MSMARGCFKCRGGEGVGGEEGGLVAGNEAREAGEAAVEDELGLVRGLSWLAVLVVCSELERGRG